MKNQKYEKEYKTICKNIARLRREQGYTQESFAQKAGISYSYYTQIEAPNVFVKISLPMLMNIADALNVDIKELFNEE